MRSLAPKDFLARCQTRHSRRSKHSVRARRADASLLATVGARQVHVTVAGIARPPMGSIAGNMTGVEQAGGHRQDEQDAGPCAPARTARLADRLRLSRRWTKQRERQQANPGAAPAKFVRLVDLLCFAMAPAPPVTRGHISPDGRSVPAPTPHHRSPRTKEIREGGTGDVRAYQRRVSQRTPPSEAETGRRRSRPAPTRVRRGRALTPHGVNPMLQFSDSKNDFINGDHGLFEQGEKRKRTTDHGNSSMGVLCFIKGH